MIAGFEHPSEGRIMLDGRDVSDLPPFARDVNTVFQDYALFPHMTVADNVGYGLMVRKISRAERAPQVENALRMVRWSTSAIASRGSSPAGSGSASRWHVRS